MSTFQIITTGIFVALVVIGVGVFSLFGGVGGRSDTGKVEVWGTLDQSTMQSVLSLLIEKDKSYQDVIYTAFSPETYNAELIDAIAAGRGPDLFFITQENMGSLVDKTVLIPYSTVSQGSYLATYIDEAQLFVTSQGLLAMPFSIDPLIMYWNRDLFTSAGVAQPPQYWNEFLTLAPKLTAWDGGQGIRRSTVALGSWGNINHAKAILSTLFMQSGDFVTSRSKETGALISVLGDKLGGGSIAPAEDALQFYTDFANPSKTAYSWNRSLPNSDQAFVANTLAVYFGFASEYTSIAERNPNLHFSIAVVPRLQNSAVHITYGSIVGLSVARGAKNPQGAVIMAQKLSSPEVSAALLAKAGSPPVRRDSLPDTSGSAALGVVVQSALISRSWVDPNKATTDNLFKVMIESVISGRFAAGQAVTEAASGLRQLLSSQ